MIRAGDLRPGDTVELDLHVGPEIMVVESIYRLGDDRPLVTFRRRRGRDLRQSFMPDELVTLVSRASNTRST